MPLGDRRERDVLASATAVVTTSAWTRRRLAELYGLPLDKVHVAEPGVDAAAVGPGSDAGAALLCVAAVTPGKGHDVMLDAFATTTDLSWRLACVGSLDRDPAFAESVQRAARQGALRDRVQFLGPRTGEELDRAYTGADLLVLASHAETYGMVVTEALARGAAGARRRRRRGGRGAWGTGTTAPGPGCSSHPAIRWRSAPRCATGSGTPSCAAACDAPRGSDARRCGDGRPRRPSSPAS